MMRGRLGRGYLRAACYALALFASLTPAQGQRYNFRVFAERAHAVSSLFETRDRALWVATEAGLSRRYQDHFMSVDTAGAMPERGPRAASAHRIVDLPTEFRQREREGSMRIDFAALRFRRPKAICFRYRLDGGWFGRPARMSVVIVGSWWRSRWLALSLAALGVTAILIFWRQRERKHRRRQRDLAVAVKQRTDELEVERSRERDSNAILEMIVANQPVGVVLDAIGNLICSQGAAEMCCVIIRRGDAQTVSADPALPRAWRTALANPLVIPFEVWRTPLVSGFATDPIWRSLTAALGESAPRLIVSRLIGNAGSPLGVVLMFYSTALAAASGTAPLGPGVESVDAALRLARIAIEHATMYENLRRQARHDPLTGLPNRLRLEECLELAIRDCDAGERKLAIFYIDLDRFKEINDTLSHRAGDLYLREIANRMRASVRNEDIVGRIGGDEFNVIVPMIPDRGVAEQIAFRLLEEIRRPVAIDGVEFCGTASLGIAIYPDDATTAEDLQRKADAAMYCAKSAGKNRFESCDSGAAVIAPNGMDQEIRSALAENRFRVDYQPKVNAAGQIAGIEALARLEHPTLGELLPGRFIAVAEQTGLIVPIGLWVLNEVCRQIADWSRRGIPVEPVAANVSPVQLCRDDFAASVLQTLNLHNVDAALLELEVSESVLVDKSDVARRQMQALRRAGVRFSIDNFGAGYSSFSYLHQLDVDAIKLDRSFVHSIETDPSARKLVQAIIGMTERMGIRVIAEGVETETQRSVLLAAGCELMQGYFFARPQAAHHIEALLWETSRSEHGILQLNRAIELAGT